MNEKSPPITLVCPLDRVPLSEANDQVIARLNRAISARRIKNRSGRLLEQSIEAGLIRDDAVLLYPVLDGIPVLLADEAIELGQLD